VEARPFPVAHAAHRAGRSWDLRDGLRRGSGACFDRGSWKKGGHYSQIVWRDTKSLGCGLATGEGIDYFVCQYEPAGNVVGTKPH
jgi:hypothetical protein